jgi:hypothetical protein
MNKTQNIEENKPNLLNTIKLDNNISLLGKKLPKSNYGDTNISRSISESKYK